MIVGNRYLFQSLAFVQKLSGVGDRPLEALDPAAFDPEAVTRELFESIERELADELNHPKEALESSPRLMGVRKLLSEKNTQDISIFMRHRTLEFPNQNNFYSF